MKKGHCILQFKSCQLLSVLLLGYTLSQYVHVLCNNISKHHLKFISYCISSILQVAVVITYKFFSVT